MVMASTRTTTMAIARAVIMAMAVAPARSMVIKMKVMAMNAEAMAARVVADRSMYWAEGGQGGDEDDGESASGSNKMAKMQMLCT
jgi:hypothetical protein